MTENISVLSETMATDFKVSNIDFEETSSNSGASQASYEPSLVDGGAITTPPMPKDAAAVVAGKPFVCPYCHWVIDVQSSRSWIRHIFKNLRPYACIFPECRTSDRLYDSRREWFRHVSTTHDLGEYLCTLCEKESLWSSKKYERHVARHLEELPLFALPRTETGAADDHEDSVHRLSVGDSSNEERAALESPVLS